MGSVDDVEDVEPVHLDRHPDTVEDVLSQEYVAVDVGMGVREAEEEFRAQAPDDDDETTVYYVYVVDEDEVLQGVLSLRKLLRADPEAAIHDVMNTDVVRLSLDEDAEDAARLLQEKDYQALPVIDSEGRLKGIARVDDLMDVLDEETSEDMYRLAGITFTDQEVSRSTAILDSPLHRILSLRMPWLLFALAGGLAAGAVIGQFEETLEAVIILAFFVPAIMDMGRQRRHAVFDYIRPRARAGTHQRRDR